MSRSKQPHSRLIQELVRLVLSRRLSGRWAMGLVAVAIAYFLLQPLLVRSLGIPLPGIIDLARVATEAPSQEKPNAPAEKPAPEDTGETKELQQILNGNSRLTYQSPAGLLYTRGSQHGHRLKHLMAHTTDQPNRPGQHGVYNSQNPEEVIALVDEAFRQAQSGNKVQVEQEDERTVYTVDLGRQIGYIGGESGNRRNRPLAQHLRLVVEGREVITAFPYRP